MDNSFLQTAGKGIPAKYQVLVEPAKVVGERLGLAIANGWDRLVDRIFSEQK